MKKIWFNADFVPMVAEDATFEAMVTDGGRIAFTGPLESARAFAPEAEEIDLKGRTVMPGFIDAHGHFGITNNVLVTADLSQCSSINEIKEALRAFLAEHPCDSDGVLVGMNYDHNNLSEYRHPTKFDLDEVSREIPIALIHVSCHMMAANTPMLELAGVNEDSEDPEGARYARVEGTREPNGYIEETAAMLPVYGAALARLNSSYDDLVEGMQDIYLSRGVTTCQEGATDERMCREFSRLGQEGRMKIDLVMYPMSSYDVEGMLRDYADLDTVEYHGHVRIGGVKTVLDGSPQGRTAWMSEPYEPGEEGEGFCSHGFKSDDEVYAFAKMAIDTGHDYLAHANGDATAEQIIRCYTRAYQESENPNKGELRPVMIHCQTMRRDQFERLGDINMVVSMFPSHVWYWGDAHLANFGRERGMRVSAVRDARDCGLVYTFHTDCPVLLPNMLEAVWCAVNRVTKKGVQLAESQKVGVFDALKAITINGAFQYHEEESKGTLEVGKLADLVVLDSNPLKVDPMKIRDIKILETVKEAETVWSC
ncbi:MAG: amidohydrolase [Collinsella sp.]|nr:amidohydrolase [Collinsella sp.]